MIYRVHDRIISQTTLQDIAESERTPREKLETFFASVLWSMRPEDAAGRPSSEARAIQIWLREALGNSEAFTPILRHLAGTKFPWLRRMFAEYLHRDEDDPVLYSAIVSTMSPILLLNLTSFFKASEAEAPMRILHDASFHRARLTFAFAGLDALKAP